MPSSACALIRSEEHTSELQPHDNLVCRLLLEKKNRTKAPNPRLRPLTSRPHVRRRLTARLQNLREQENRLPMWRYSGGTKAGAGFFFNDTAAPHVTEQTLRSNPVI